MSELIYPRERILGTITLILGIVVWVCLIVGTVGTALIGLLIGFIFYLFAQSAFIAHIKGNGVEISEHQFPDLHQQFVFCCDQLQMAARPKAYILNGNGGLNAFATKFLGAHFVILMSDVVDAMAAHADGVKFYIGHELGHIKRKHISGNLLRMPVLWLPLLGAAYSRAKESTCDRHGLACCQTPEGAGRALAALSAGGERWKDMNIQEYSKQTQYTSGFWMSLHELFSGYPWVTKRVARLVNPAARDPKRHALAYLLALFVPYAGRMGAGFSFLVVVYIIGVLAAVAIPQYHNYQVKAQITGTVIASQSAREALANRYVATNTIPTLEEVGISDTLPDGSTLTVNPENMVLSVHMKAGELLLVPSADRNNQIIWECQPGEGLTPAQLPPSCP